MTYIKDFRQSPTWGKNWHVMGSPTGDLSKDNAELTDKGLVLWCRNGQGGGVMLDRPKRYGLWEVRMRIEPGSTNPSTKVCLLLWPDGGGWPPEIDFNESGDRTRSNQTLHYDSDNKMLHTSYPVDQTKWHTYGARVTSERVVYRCDDVFKGMVTNFAPGILWNVHLRTETNGYDDETKLQVRWVRISD